jgi:hypothetical protein
MSPRLPEPSRGPRRLHCPQCGTEPSPHEIEAIAGPYYGDTLSDEDHWLMERNVPCGWPMRQWTCARCGRATRTLEVSVEFLHRITADSPSKAEHIAKRSAGASRNFTPSHVEATTALAVIVGSGQQPRADAVAKLWAYIKDKGLQHDGADRRLIDADETLRAVFGKNQISMFEISTLLKKHLIPSQKPG